MGNFTDNLKSAIPSEMAKAGVLSKGTEGMLASSEFVRALGEDEEVEEATGAGSAGQISQPLFSKVEATEATGSGSSGSYETPAAWAKTMSKKNWRGKSKPLIPGGKFVQVKSKCKKFPYCNQGDIKALKIFENETIKKVISKISKERNISENVIKSIIAYEYEKKYLNE
jgi:hypothetical protein